MISCFKKIDITSFCKKIDIISCCKKILNSIWVQGASIQELFLAYTLYPTTNKDVKNKILSGLIFYVSFAVGYTGYLSHGYFFNYYTGSPTLSKIFSYHPDLPYSFKIFKALASFGLSEALCVHLYSLFLYFRRKGQFERIFRLEPLVDQSLKRKMLKVLEILYLMNSLFGMTVTLIFNCYGMDGTDFTGKLIAIIWAVLAIPYCRFPTCLIFLLYSYIILIAHTVKKLSSDTVAFCQRFNADSRTFDDRSVKMFLHRYMFIVTTISDTQGFISNISTPASLLIIPLMSLTWLLLFDETGTLFLRYFKWSFFPISAYYSSRICFFNAYFSKIHSESKELHSTLNSLIARDKVSPEGKKTLLFIIENISGRRNPMAYRDSIGSLVEQMDVLRSISATFELLLLAIGFRYKNLAY